MATLGKALALVAVAFFGLATTGWSQTPGLTAFSTAPVASMAPMLIAKEAGCFYPSWRADVQSYLPARPQLT